jgi:hypothetical protein
VKKLTLTTGALTAIAGSVLLTGIAFASDAMRSSDHAAGGFVASLALSDERNLTKDEVIGTANVVMNDNDQAADVDVDEDANNDVDNEVDEDNDNDEVDTDVDKQNEDEQAKDNTKHDTNKHDTQDKVAADRHRDEGKHRGR